jgi:hypothetical protein
MEPSADPDEYHQHRGECDRYAQLYFSFLLWAVAGIRISEANPSSTMTTPSLIWLVDVVALKFLFGGEDVQFFIRQSLF